MTDNKAIAVGDIVFIKNFKRFGPGRVTEIYGGNAAIERCFPKEGEINFMGQQSISSLIPISKVELASTQGCQDEPLNVRTFRKIVNDMADLYKRKNEAYGNSFDRSVKKYGAIAALTRISDKFNRLESLVLGAKNDVPDESIYDTLTDLASYCVMTSMVLKAVAVEKDDFENVK